MKNKKRIVFLLILVGQFMLFAEDWDLKQYSDSSTDYNSLFHFGYARAKYICHDSDKNHYDGLLDKLNKIKGREVSKLSKNTSWLCWKALCEYELEPNEVYFIMCQNDILSATTTAIIAIINSDGTFCWLAKEFDTRLFKGSFNYSL